MRFLVSTQAIRKQAHFGMEKLCIFNGHSGGSDDWDY
jgi:hypothetical protein